MIDWVAVGFYALVAVMALVLSYPVWRLSKAVVFRFTKSDDRPVLAQFAFVLFMGGLAAVWGRTHASMFADVRSQSTATEMLFMALAGSAALVVMNLTGSALIGAFNFALLVIRGSAEER